MSGHRTALRGAISDPPRSGQEFHHGDGRVEHGPDAIQAMMQWVDGMRQHNRRVLAMSPEKRLAAPRLRMRRPNTPSGRPRASATRSSARSGDSGESDPAEPEEAPPPAWPAHGLAVCPVCSNGRLKGRCRLCGGLRFIGRAARNTYKVAAVGA